MIHKLKIIIIVILILIIVTIPNLEDNKKFRLRLLSGSFLNKGLLLLLILFVMLEDYLVGLVLTLLFYVIYIETNRANKNIYEGFIDYFIE